MSKGSFLKGQAKRKALESPTLRWFIPWGDTVSGAKIKVTGSQLDTKTLGFILWTFNH